MDVHACASTVDAAVSLLSAVSILLAIVSIPHCPGCQDITLNISTTAQARCVIPVVLRIFPVLLLVIIVHIGHKFMITPVPSS